VIYEELLLIFDYGGALPRTQRQLGDQQYRYIIYDEIRKNNYFLDAGGKVERYDEKRVEIEGTLERQNTAIRVDSIKALD